MAMVRAADAMLHALGGSQVMMLTPLVGMPNDPSAQLGLVDPGVQQVALYPVVVRSLTATAHGPRRRLEFLISASAVADAVVAQDVASADALFESALGLQYSNDLFHIVDVTPEFLSETPYLYRVTAVE